MFTGNYWRYPANNLRASVVARNDVPQILPHQVQHTQIAFLNLGDKLNPPIAVGFICIRRTTSRLGLRISQIKDVKINEIGDHLTIIQVREVELRCVFQEAPPAVVERLK